MLIMTFRLVEISSIAEEAPGILRFELVDPERNALPAFAAGAHIDVHVGEGLVRQYSLCNRPGESQSYEIAVLRTGDSRGGSIAMHALTVGEKIRISEPKNNFQLVQPARHSLFFAGGIGITPIISMAEHLSETGSDFQLHYCTRSLALTAFREQIRQSGFSDSVHFHHDDGPLAQILDAKTILAVPDINCHIYVCGPQAFMDWILDTARQAGWQEQQLHLEYFTADQPILDSGVERGFEVEIASTGVVVEVAPDQTVLAALSGMGIDIPSSCENGVCGTCLTRIQAGIPDHRDMYLSPEEQAVGDQFTPCCSRAKSARLVLDL